ncbi:MAG: hypothetical protein ACI8ZF_000738 [Candidatus Midichloriaceae bacterium]|jgi:hypothetical protein
MQKIYDLASRAAESTRYIPSVNVMYNAGLNLVTVPSYTVKILEAYIDGTNAMYASAADFMFALNFTNDPHTPGHIDFMSNLNIFAGLNSIYSKLSQKEKICLSDAAVFVGSSVIVGAAFIGVERDGKILMNSIGFSKAILDFKDVGTNLFEDYIPNLEDYLTSDICIKIDYHTV